MSVWSALWPNLLANVLWVPVVWAYHKVNNRRHADHIRQLHQEHRRDIQLLLNGKETP
ncbi:hypothetical protein [Aquabacterium sp.]|uniref:hypothetical protein n=1 Tax=Aquabacterium sp. TaxID=1872578 RepID=UPI0025BDA007|nr:hypothetical protein [Aquabacterium sp.]